MTHPAQDIREQLRRDHDVALAELRALRRETDERRCRAQLIQLRQAWMVHALAEETVVYRALEGLESASGAPHPAGERFVENELVGGLFEKLVALRRGTLEWQARLTVLADLIAHHNEKEQIDVFARLAARFSAEELLEMGRRFRLASDKLALLEDAKAA